MSSEEINHPQIGIIKSRARELGERMSDKHDPDVVSQFVQFSLGVSSLNRLSGNENDFVQVMRSGAKLAARNLFPETTDHVVEELLRDEELCSEIIETELVLRSRALGPTLLDN